MFRLVRRARGAFLRVAFDRRSAVALGLLLVLAWAVLWAGDHAGETWLMRGLGLVAGATGAALILAGLTGRRPDWIE